MAEEPELNIANSACRRTFCITTRVKLLLGIIGNAELLATKIGFATGPLLHANFLAANKV
jgi:hypothetical protein